MGYINSNLAREIARRTGWEDKVWSRRYQAIPVSAEESAQVARLEYLLSHGCKEGLVERLADWPGVHCATALRTGDPVEGTWFDRTQEWSARQRGIRFEPRQFASTEKVVLSPLPYWRHLSRAVQALVAALIEEIETRVAAVRAATGAPVLGPVAIQGQHPHDRPKRAKKSSAPLFHAFTKSARKLFLEAYSRFVTAFREAAASLKAGDLTACFPMGCFPPGLPFVTASFRGWALGRSGRRDTDKPQKGKMSGSCLHRPSIQRARRSRQDLRGDRWHQAYSFFRLGHLHLGLGRYREALDLFSRAAPLFDAVHDGHFLGASRGEIGSCYLGLADFGRALGADQEALALQRRRDDVKEQAVLLYNLGKLFQLQSRSSEALAAFRESLDLYEKLGGWGRSGAANALTGIGWVYGSLGDPVRAVEAHFGALFLRNRLGDGRGRTISLTQIGNVLLPVDPQRGLLFYERALTLERQAGYLPEQGVTLNGIGIALRELGRYGEARATYLEALKLYGSPADPDGQAAAWINLGWSAVHLDRPGEALDAFGRGLRLARERHDPSREARALLGMAEAERERGNLILAEERAEASLRLFETLRTAVVRSDLQASYLAANENVYAILIRILGGHGPGKGEQ